MPVNYLSVIGVYSRFNLGDRCALSPIVHPARVYKMRTNGARYETSFFQNRIEVLNFFFGLDELVKD
jgi:hypothetical protein